MPQTTKFIGKPRNVILASFREGWYKMQLIYMGTFWLCASKLHWLGKGKVMQSGQFFMENNIREDTLGY